MGGNCFKLPIFFVILQFVFIFSQEIFSQTKPQKTKEADYCSLFTGELDNHESEIVRTRAFLTYSTVLRVDGGDSFFYSPNCNNADFFAVSAVTSDGKNPWAKWNRKFSKLAKEKNYVFEVILNGRVQTSIFPNFGGWRSEFEVFTIEYIKNVTSTVVAPNYESESPLNKKGKSLLQLNEIILSSFAFGNSYSDLSEYLADDFAVRDSLGNDYNRQNYPELIKKGIGATVKFEAGSFSLGRPERTQNSYKVYGEIKGSNKQGDSETLKYKNTYRLENDSWLLTKIKFSKS